MKKWVVSLAIAGAIGFVAVPQLAADHHDEGSMEMTAEQKAEFEKWQQMAAPGKPHEDMAMFAGSWDATITTWMAPGEPPMKSTGKSRNKMILGGRYLEQEYKGEVMGMPFEGLGLMTYDNYGKEYVSLWIDNMSTMILTMTGSADASGKTVTLTGTAPNMMSGQEETMRSVQKMVDEDTFVFERYRPGPDGKEFKNMEITYTRSADTAKKRGS